MRGVCPSASTFGRSGHTYILAGTALARGLRSPTAPWGRLSGCARPPPTHTVLQPRLHPYSLRRPHPCTRCAWSLALAPRRPSRLRPRARPLSPLNCPLRPRLTPLATPCVGALEGPFDLAKGRERRAEGRSGDGVARACSASAQVPVGKPRGGVGAASARLFARHRCPGHPPRPGAPH